MDSELSGVWGEMATRSTPQSIPSPDEYAAGTLFGQLTNPAVKCIIGPMIAPPDPTARSMPIGPRRKNPLSPKKLLLSKWTAVSPANNEKHFVVTRVVEPDPPAVRIEWVEIEAVHSGRSSMLRWRDLTDGSRWRQGWV